MRMVRRFLLIVTCGLCWSTDPAVAQRPLVTDAMRPFISLDAPVVALTNARVIDGTGAPARANQTILLRDGDIVAVGPASSIAVPSDAKLLDLSGKTVLPGLVQLHEHLWLANERAILNTSLSYSRLYLAAGVTSLRTAGAYNPYGDLKTRADIEAGAAVGPWMDLSIYMDTFGAPRLVTAEQARKYVDFWLDSGFTSVKAYASTGAIPMKAAIDAAHRRNLKLTGHVCRVTYREAADLGIDNLEHGFVMAPDFITGESSDICRSARIFDSLDSVDPNAVQAKSLIAHLIARNVAVTSTLVTFEDFIPDIPPQRGIELLTPALQEFHAEYRAKLKDPKNKIARVKPENLRKSAAMELDFMRSGGLLVSGTDPCVPSIGVIAGYGSERQLEIMVENGFTPLEAIRVATLNGAIYLKRDDRIGSVAAGKQADLLIVDGDPATNISDIAQPWMVIKLGIGYDPEKLRASVRGRVGLQ